MQQAQDEAVEARRRRARARRARWTGALVREGQDPDRALPLMLHMTPDERIEAFAELHVALHGAAYSERSSRQKRAAWPGKLVLPKAADDERAPA